jgi:hypothetical protein
LPPDFEVAELLETGRFRLRPLTVQEVIKDSHAVMTSRDNLWRQFWAGMGAGHRRS